MKITTAGAIINASMWISTSVVIAVALYLTRNINCLWFLLIPACSGYRFSYEKNQMAGDNSIQIQSGGDKE